MKTIGIILSIIIGLIVFICLTSYLDTFDLHSHSWLYAVWTWINGMFAGIIAINYSKSFYKWFNSHLKSKEDEGN